MFIVFQKKNITFNKKIKIQLQLGLSKLTPKLNLTLAPLGINSVNFISEFNKFDYIFFDEFYLLNCVLYINNKTLIYNLNIINFTTNEIFIYFYNQIYNKNVFETVFFLAFLKYYNLIINKNKILAIELNININYNLYLYLQYFIKNDISYNFRNINYHKLDIFKILKQIFNQNIYNKYFLQGNIL